MQLTIVKMMDQILWILKSVINQINHLGVPLVFLVNILIHNIKETTKHLHKNFLEQIALVLKQENGRCFK